MTQLTPDRPRGRTKRPALRIVARNDGLTRPLLPLHVLERRLAIVTRRLRHRTLSDQERDILLRRRTLLEQSIAARPFESRKARMLEQHLRWLDNHAALPGPEPDQTRSPVANAVLRLVSLVARPSAA